MLKSNVFKPKTKEDVDNKLESFNFDHSNLFVYALIRNYERYFKEPIPEKVQPLFYKIANYLVDKKYLPSPEYRYWSIKIRNTNIFNCYVHNYTIQVRPIKKIKEFEILRTDDKFYIPDIETFKKIIEFYEAC